MLLLLAAGLDVLIIKIMIKFGRRNYQSEKCVVRLILESKILQIDLLFQIISNQWSVTTLGSRFRFSHLGAAYVCCNEKGRKGLFRGPLKSPPPIRVGCLPRAAI